MINGASSVVSIVAERSRPATRSAREFVLPENASPRQIEEFLVNNDDGSPLTTEHLARVMGVTSATVRADIRHGELRANLIGPKNGRRSRRFYRVKFDEARRYLSEMGVIDLKPKPR